ncbi:hypothetical protein ACFXHA_38850 [Nocardia sp. NPDC059240]|uniref:hypothetical protein n=1 Tax=Nocardia sp. NPDC059240 TaxID=3346786 RepID=UPI0036A0AD11
MRVRHRRTAYGTWNPDRAPADPVRAHVADLEEAGLSRRRLAELAGVHRSVLATLLHGKAGRPLPQWISHATAAKILAVAVPDSAVAVAAPNDTVAGVGAQRRLQALVAIGYPQTHLARELEMLPTNLGPLLHGGQEAVTIRRHRQIAALFDRLEMVPGPSDAAREYARTKRWAVPMQWDRETIDDPATRRHRVRRYPAPSPRATKQAR